MVTKAVAKAANHVIGIVIDAHGRKHNIGGRGHVKQGILGADESLPGMVAIGKVRAHGLTGKDKPVRDEIGLDGDLHVIHDGNHGANHANRGGDGHRKVSPGMTREVAKMGTNLPMFHVPVQRGRAVMSEREVSRRVGLPWK